MPGTATLDDIVDDSKAGGTATLADIDETPPEVKQALASVPRPKFNPPAPLQPWYEHPSYPLEDIPEKPAAPGSEAAGAPQPPLRIHPSEVLGMGVEALSNPSFTTGGPTGIPSKGPQVVQGARNIRTPGRRLTGALQLAEAGTEALTPLMGPAAIENPVSLAKGVAEGYAASKGAGYVAKKAGATEENKDLIESIAFWAPGVARSMAGMLGLAEPKVGVQTGPEGTGVGISGSGGTKAGVAVTPEEVRIGGQFRGGQPHEVRIPRNGAPQQPALEAPTIEGQVMPPPSDIPQPTEPHPGAPVDNIAEGASNAVAMANEEAQAMRMVSGLPPTPPPPVVPPAPAPPLPPGVENNNISPETVQKIGAVIAKVPAELRPQAIIETHQTLSQAILQQGKVVTPSGTLEIVTKPEQAEKLAQRIINDEVKRQDKVLAEAEESRQKGATATPPAAAPQKKSAKEALRDSYTELNGGKPYVPLPAKVITNGNTFEYKGGQFYKNGRMLDDSAEIADAADALGSVDRGSFQDKTIEGEVQSAHVSEIQEELQTAKLEDIQDDGRGNGEQRSNSIAAINAGKPSAERGAGAVSEGTPRPNELHANSASESAQPQTSGSSSPAKFQKGDQVQLKDGTKAEVTYTHPTMSIVRVKTADGRKLSLGARSLSAVSDIPESKPAATPSTQKAAEVTQVAPLEPGKMGEMKVSDLRIAPHKFQYKLGTDAEGVGTLLKEQKVFNPDLAGVVSTWRDPADNKMYVVNGHHRVELAKRTGQKTIAVRHIKAKDATEARAIGAQQNIAEGRGTAIDAAKYFRDTGTTAADLSAKGISLGEATAKDGLALSKLDPAIFNRVVSGDLRQGRATAIGEASDNPAEQKAILSLVEKREAKGGKVNDDTLRELIRMVKGSEQTTETTADLFGSREITRSMALEKAEISAHIKQQLAKDKKLFGFVAKEGRATQLARAGNKIDVEKSKEISTGAAQAEEVYNKLSERGGPIASILDKAARRLADGKESPAAIKSDAYQRVRSEVSKTLSGSEGPSAGRSEGTPGSEELEGKPASKPEGAVDLFHDQQPLTAPAFYSKAEKIVEQKVPNAASGAAVLATLRNNGVKPDEIKWLGLDDFLRDKFRVTKQQLQEFIRENSLQIKDVTKGVKPKPERNLVWKENRRGLWAWFEGDNQVSGAYPDETDDENARQSISQVKDAGAAKYESYTLPGEKKNYTELLLTLPKASPQALDPEIRRLSKWPDDATVAKNPSDQAHLDRLNREWEKRNDSEFVSGHFDEKNILAHVRFDERTDSEGKRVLFLEEVQSDWHQKGKRQGYQGKTPTPFPPNYHDYGIAIGMSEAEIKSTWNTTDQRFKDWNEMWLKQHEMATKERQGVPDAPFKSDWHELAMKRMLREAAEQGYDKLAWVTGAQTADRYNLAKVINNISWIGNKVEMSPHGGDRLSFELRDGRVFNPNGPATSLGLGGKSLDDVVGKEIAAKITSAKDGFLEGPDLKVGGDWAKRLYDNAIPNFLNKYGKKWGVKVGDAEFVSGKTDKRPADQILREEFGTNWGDATPEQRDQAFEIQEGKIATPTKVHSIPVTSEMKRSVMEEGQPLFHSATGPILPSDAKAVKFEVRKPGKGLPNYLRLNPAAMSVMHRIFGHGFGGVNMATENAEWAAERIGGMADQMENRGHSEAAAKIRALQDAMLENADEHDGLTMVAQQASPEHEARVIREELMHAVVQRRPGKGNVTKGTPWEEMQNDPAFKELAPQLADRLESVGLEARPDVVVAEAIIDLIGGEIGGPPARIKGAVKAYFEAVAKTSGDAPLEGARAVLDFIDGDMADQGIIRPGEKFDGDLTAPARETIEALLAGRHARGRGEEIAPSSDGGAAESQRGDLQGSTATGVKNDNVSPGEISRGGGAAEGTPATKKPTDLASTQPVGLTDEELGNWAQSSGFRYEPAGEQLGMFGANDQVLRVYRIGPKGKEQSGLVYQQQLDNLNKPKEEANPNDFQLTSEEAPKEDQPRLFGAGDLGEIIGGRNSLFNSESGSFEPGKIVSYLRDEIHANKQARELHSGLNDLESQHQADVLRAVHTMEAVNKELGKDAPKEFAHVYDHLEDPEGIPLSPAQDKLLDEIVLPLMEESNRIFTKLTDGGVPAENYVHRVVKGKGGFFDRIMAGSKGTGRGNLLQKSSPQQKHRTMMALERVPEEPAYPYAENKNAPERKIISIKGGMVTAWDKGKPDFMGGLRSGLTTRQGELHDKIHPIQQQIRKLQHERRILSETPGRIATTFERRKNISEEIDKLEKERDALINQVSPDDLHDQRFIDKQGREWEITQATTKEIEANTDLRYYHNALASALVSYLQLRKAERGFDFIESFKNDPQFAEIAQKQGTGNPPEGWRSTDLPQLRGYYFEPHTAEVLDWYAKKLKMEGPNIFDKLGHFLRNAIFFNPLLHVPNISVHWAVEKGPVGFLRPARFYRTSIKAINAVFHQNQDFLDALDAGGPLQSQRQDTNKLTQLFFDQLTDSLNKDEGWATKIAAAVGMSPVNLVKAIYKFSGNVTWTTNDVAFLQATYEKMEGGMPLKEALKQTGKHIPDYRLPVRIFNSTSLAKVMSSPSISMFGAYHYGALKSYGEMAKSALGASEPPPGRSKAAESAHGLQLMAWLGVITFVLYPLMDELIRKATGDKDARLRRAGASTFLFNTQKLIQHEKTPTEVLESVATPAAHTKAALELALNRDFYSGHELHNWHADARTQGQQLGRFLIDTLAPSSQGRRIAEGGEQRRRALYGMLGVSFPKTGAEKIASDIARSHLPTKAMTSEQEKSYQVHRAILDGLRKGTAGPLNEALKDHTVTPEEASRLRHRARLTPLQDKVHDFTYLELMRVYAAATPEQKKELEPIARTKRANLLRKHRGAEVETADQAVQ